MAVYGPFKRYFEIPVDAWMKRTARKVTMFQMGGLCDMAYSRAATMENAVSGFMNTGITNCDISVFAPQEFAAAEAYDKSSSDSDDESDGNGIPDVGEGDDNNNGDGEVVPRPVNDEVVNPAKPAATPSALTSNEKQDKPFLTPSNKSVRTCKENMISPEKILPIPKIPSAKKAQPNPRKKTSAIFPARLSGNENSYKWWKRRL